MNLFPKLRKKLQNSTGSYNATPLSNSIIGIGNTTSAPRTTRNTPTNNLTFANNTMYNNGRAVGSAVTGNTRSTRTTPTLAANPVTRVQASNTMTTPSLTPPTPRTQVPLPAMTTTFSEPAVPVPQMYNDPNGFYTSEDRYNRGNIDRFVSNSQDDWDRYLTNAGIQFQDDRYKLDEDAANTGNLFGGARVKRRNKLQDSYNRDIEGKRAKVIQAIQNNLSDYEYQFGSDNTPSVSLANGNVNALSPVPQLVRSNSQVYSPSNDFYGTMNTTRDINEFIRNLTGQGFVRNTTRLPGYYTPNGGYQTRGY